MEQIVLVGIVFSFISMGIRLSTPTADADVCFSGGGELVKPEFVVSNLLLTANWFDTEEELATAVSALGYEVEENLEVSECEVHPDQDIGWCELWLVIPKYVIGDPYMDSLGHEAGHGFFGDFHE